MRFVRVVRGKKRNPRKTILVIHKKKKSPYPFLLEKQVKKIFF
jgi:hypothetical protein